MLASNLRGDSACSFLFRRFCHCLRVLTSADGRQHDQVVELWITEAITTPQPHPTARTNGSIHFLEDDATVPGPCMLALSEGPRIPELECFCSISRTCEFRNVRTADGDSHDFYARPEIEIIFVKAVVMAVVAAPLTSGFMLSSQCHKGVS